MLALALADFNATREMGPILALGVAITVLASLTLLPAVLAALGTRAFWLAPRARRERPGIWARAARLVEARPVAVAAAVTAVLVGGCLGNLEGRETLTFADAFRGDEPDSVRGQEVIRAKFPPGRTAPLDLVLSQEISGPVISGLNELEEFERVDWSAGSGALDEDPEVPIGELVLAEAHLRVDPLSDRARDQIPVIREELGRLVERAKADVGFDGEPVAALGGFAAESYDTAQAMRRDALIIVPVALLLVMAIMFFVFRAPATALYVVATVLLSFGCALGLSSLAFTHLFGQPASDPSLAIFAFIFLVALGRVRSGRMAVTSKRLQGWLAAALAAGAVLAAPASAQAARPLATGFGDTAMYVASPDRALWFERTREAGAELVRINLQWRAVAPTKPANPESPADPAYDFSRIDAAVRAAAAQGLRIMITARGAPSWAEGANRPGGVTPGAWKPKPKAFGRFATALARRYSGTFNPGAGGVLPRVQFLQAWNEPNLSTYLAPQYKGKRAVSPGHYRKLLNAFYAGVRRAGANQKVVTAGTGPYGDPPGGKRVRPLAFWRSVLCLKGRKALRKRRCPNKAKLDVLAHHPINTSGGPGRSAVHPDDVTTPDMGALRRVLRAAERKRTIRPAGRRPLWVTEFWYDSRPPDTVNGVPVRKHARWIAESLFRYWRGGASAAINLQIRDQPFDPGSAGSATASGVYFVDGTRKPAFRAFRFPAVARRAAGRTVKVWVRPPVGGKVRVQVKRKAGWRTLASRSAKAGVGIRIPVRLKRRKGTSWRLSATVAGERSFAARVK